MKNHLTNALPVRTFVPVEGRPSVTLVVALGMQLVMQY